MSDTWVVAADSVRARLFKVAKGRRLEEVADLVAPEDRLKNQDINSDRGGRAFDSMGRGRHAMEKSESPHEHAVRTFAARVVERLEHGRTAGEFDKLVVVAAPRMLGYLRACFDDPLHDLVVCSIHKELTQETPERIAEYLPQVL
ncbi:MAG: host attachment protein [Pseudomonadales bacterium]